MSFFFNFCTYFLLFFLLSSYLLIFNASLQRLEINAFVCKCICLWRILLVYGVYCSLFFWYFSCIFGSFSTYFLQLETKERKKEKKQRKNIFCSVSASHPGVTNIHMYILHNVTYSSWLVCMYVRRWRNGKFRKMSRFRF